MEPNPTTAGRVVPAPDRFDGVCIGETMVGFVSHDGSRTYLAVPAGAESNVAAGMAGLGCRTQWVSRLGDDTLGRLVDASVCAAGVAVAAVRDGERPTGVLTKHVTGSATSVQYYRRHSAASALSAGDLDRAGTAKWMHITGITPALSESAADLAEAVVERRTGHTGRISFDVNHRPVLWPSASAAAMTLLSLSRRADVVFIGDDEAQALFGTSETSALAELILRRDDQELVIKRGGERASVVTSDGEVSEPALAAHVVDVTGAGDAFAAGYLAASCFGWPLRARLRLGHMMGSRVVGVLEDTPPPFSAGEIESLSPATLARRWEDDRPS